MPKGQSKDVRSQGGGGLSSANKGEGFFRCGRPHFFGAKTSDFSKFMMSARTRRKGELSQCRHIADKEEPIFRDFVRTSFIDGP